MHQTKIHRIVAACARGDRAGCSSGVVRPKCQQVTERGCSRRPPSEAISDRVEPLPLDKTNKFNPGSDVYSLFT
jgi:hypothetical protein